MFPLDLPSSGITLPPRTSSALAEPDTASRVMMKDDSGIGTDPGFRPAALATQTESIGTAPPRRESAGKNRDEGLAKCGKSIIRRAGRWSREGREHGDH